MNKKILSVLSALLFANTAVMADTMNFKLLNNNKNYGGESMQLTTQAGTLTIYTVNLSDADFNLLENLQANQCFSIKSDAGFYKEEGYVLVESVEQIHQIGCEQIAAQPLEQWRSGWGQGVAEAFVQNGPDNQIYIACTDEPNLSTTISFKINGEPAPARSEVLLTFDDQWIQGYQVNAEGEIDSDCRVCAENFSHALNLLKKHNNVTVRFDNGQSSRFSLKGSSKAIGDCPADFYR